MAKVLVTGGAGYIGNMVCTLMLQKGHQVRAVDVLWFDEDIPLVHLSNPNYEFIKGDIRSSELSKNLVEDIEFIIHTAAVVGEPACQKYPALTQEINYEASTQLIDNAKEAGTKGFIFFSTCSNYGVADGMATEETKLKPLSSYAETKVKVEEYLINEIKDLDWIVCRLLTVYGVPPRMRFDLTINDFSLNAYKKKYLDVFLPYTHRSYIHVFDVANVVAALVEKFDNVKNNVFNVGFEGENYQKISIAEAVKKYVPNLEIEIVEKGADLRDYQVDFSKLEKYLKLEKTHDVEKGVKEIIDLLKMELIKNTDDRKYYNTSPSIGG